jgi:hypothetical protein
MPWSIDWRLVWCPCRATDGAPPVGARVAVSEAVSKNRGGWRWQLGRYRSSTATDTSWSRSKSWPTSWTLGIGRSPASHYSSDYPHEVDLLDAQRQIERTQDHPELSDDDKAAILGNNSRRFFRL